MRQALRRLVRRDIRLGRRRLMQRMVTVEVERDTMESQSPPEVVNHQNRQQDHYHHNRADCAELLEELDSADVVLAERRANDRHDTAVQQRASRGSKQERS